MEAGREIIIGSDEISSSNLSDTVSILNTSAYAQTKPGNLTVNGTFRAGDLELSDTSHQVQVDVDGHILFCIPGGDEYRFVIAGADTAVLSATAMTIAGQMVATQAYVTTTLTSTKTASSTLGFVQASPLILAQTLTCNNNLICNAAATFSGTLALQLFFR